jgi:hypothetical protein
VERLLSQFRAFKGDLDFERFSDEDRDGNGQQ